MPKNTKVVAQPELSHIAGGSIDWYNYFRKLAVSNKAKYLVPYYTSNKNKCYAHQETCARRFTTG